MRAVTVAAVAALLGLPLAGAPSPAAAATAQVARVDPSYGGGFTSHSFSDLDDRATAVTLQPDGKSIVVGKTNTEEFDHTPADLFVARFTAAGALDPGFGSGGVKVIGQPDRLDSAEAVAVQKDGKIVVGGVVADRPSVLRLTASGELDAEFQGGIVAILDDSSSPVTALTLQPDGKIAFTGGALAAGRLNADCTMDNAFGTGGLVPLPKDWEGRSYLLYRAIAVQPDGKVVVGGSSNGPSFGGPSEYGSVARFTSAGAPDPTFGEDGYVRTDLDVSYANRGTGISSLALQPDGRIVAVGRVYEWAMSGAPMPGQDPPPPSIRHMGLSDVAVFRYLADGRLDPSFAGRGLIVARLTSRTVPTQPDWPIGRIGVPETETRGADVSVGADGAITVVGDTYEFEPVPLVLRYTSSGLLDTTFGHDGALVVDMKGLWGRPAAMAVQPDGRLVVVGSSRTGLIERGRYWDLMIGRVIPVAGAGTVWAWGWNPMGQLGDGTKTDRRAPAQVPGLTGVVSVSAGAYHTLALKGDGTVWAWGSNVTGQLGDGTTVDRSRPVKVSGLTGVVAVSAGGLHNLAVKGDGTMWAWGFNGFGQLGDGTRTMRLTPVRVRGLEGMVAGSAGLYHSFGIRDDGMALAWGYNAAGQLGDGTTTDRLTAVWLKLMPVLYAYHQLSAGSLHSLAVTVNAGMGSTGWNGLRQVNAGGPDIWTEFGAALPGFTHGASAGWYHSLVLHTNGSVRSSGWNVVGQLGDGSTVTRGWAPVPGLTGVWTLSAGGLHSLALKEDGSLVGWGWNVVGQLGTGSTVDARSPVTVDSSGQVAAVSAGYLHSVAVKR